MRDYLQDGGSIPSSGNICTSPDIFVRNARVNNPDIGFGEKSALRNVDNLSEEVTDNNTAKYIYMRVSNRGTAPAAGVKLTIYYASPSTYLTPGQLNLIGTLDSTQTFIVPGGNKMRVAEIVWPAGNIPNPGHYCFFGIVESYTDKPQDFSSITDLASFLNYVRNNNNAAWRNFNVVPINSPGAIARAGGVGNAHAGSNEPVEFGLDAYDGVLGGAGNAYAGFSEPAEDEIVLQFFVTGAEFEDAEMRLEIGGDLPPEATIHFEADQGFLQNMLGDNLEVVETEKELESRIVRAHMGSPDQANQDILPFLFPKDLRVPASLIVHLPEELRTRPYDIFIRQFHKEIEVGRITWRLVPHSK
jgi:serine protease